MKPDPIRVLLIEDERADVLLLRRRLDRAGLASRYRVKQVQSLQAGLDALGKAEFDVLLLDLHLPDSVGLETVRRLRESDPDTPIVVFTTRVDEETTLGALQAGAQDYLVKDELMSAELIQRSIRYAIERRRLAQENEHLQARLRAHEKAESLRWLAAGVATGFNSALGTILEHTDRAVEQLVASGASSGLHAELVAIRRQTLRTAEIASHLRSYATRAPRPVSLLQLSELVVELSPLLESLLPPNVQLQLDLCGDVAPVNADLEEVRELLVNLVLNASEAIGGRPGSVEVGTGSRWLDRALLERTHAEPDLAEGTYGFLRVADTGPPISSRIESRMFDPFFTTRRAGRGLGLAAALGIARRHRGAIQVEHRDRGACLTVFLPLWSRGSPRLERR